MADAHGADDPNAAPMHHEIHERFSSWQVAFCVVLGAIAIVGGLVAGLLVVND